MAVYYDGDLERDLADIGRTFPIERELAKQLDEIGQQIGYGRSQQILQILWAKRLQEKNCPTNGALLTEMADDKLLNIEENHMKINTEIINTFVKISEEEAAKDQHITTSFSVSPDYVSYSVTISKTDKQLAEEAEAMEKESFLFSKLVEE